MPDPIEELENFSIPGPAMTPMPATEVRRRGTRLRRRNNALVAAGALAVVAAIATPFTVFAGHQDSSKPLPTPPGHTWKQEIPQDFPLAQDMFGDPKVTGRSGVDDIKLCGTTAWSPGGPVATVDLAGASYAADGESQAGRTLALYADDQAAGRALASIRTAVQDCPTDPNGDGLPLVSESLSPDLGGDDSYTFIQRSKDGNNLAELSLYEVVRSGNALYVDFSYGAAGDDQAVSTAMSNMGDRSKAARGALCTFSAAGCGTDSGQAEDPSSEVATSIPDGFELLAGLPSEGATKHFGRSESGAELDPIDLSACGRTAAPADAVEDLRADFTAPEGIWRRQLMVFADQAAAESWMVEASDTYTGCVKDGGNGVTGEWTVTGSPLGEGGQTAMLRHYVDGEPGLGYEIVNFARVGAAVVVSQTSIDGESEIVTDQRAAELVTTSHGELNPVVDQMCVYGTNRC